MLEINKIAFIGSGNVATHMAQAFFKAGIHIIGFYGRNQQSTQELALKYHAEWGAISDIKYTVLDLLIISVPDHAIEEVLKELTTCPILITHTSGSLSMEVLQIKGDRFGVCYPLQTFSKEKEVDFSKIPMMLEATREKDLEALKNLAKKISPKVYKINSSQRKKIHIAAVFAANFSNYLYHIAEDLLLKNDIPFEVIQPLIEETSAKIKSLSPYEAQTGPAHRNDQETIDAHIKDLEDIPEYQEIYKLLSQRIKESRK